ncbi:hypothetical protein GCM10011579_039740 [Streptomyces albiflavescens]|uniref:Uncharacterized protein n=1 Tax=Streptomyces albiflavescens TaxID=1623582 RepID=A0A917Y430_9ACTN|nr:hypothetical protein [Streptomyces albiflavescens]GGN67326.1 hypothetical protein GCM10011579_039740 [Streptomyces albiflavescens]
MAIASTAEARTRLTSFRDVPASKRARRTGRGARDRRRVIKRRVGAVLLTVLSTFTLWFTMATPSQALGDDIISMCGPLNVTFPENRGSGLEAFFGTYKPDTAIPPSEYATYIPKANKPYDGPKPSYHRYGMSGLTWNTFGWTPGCFSINRFINFVPNMIFNLSKTFATFTMALIAWCFGKDPFSFLQTPIANVAGAMSDVATPFLGLVGALGGIYLGVKNWGPQGRITAVLKGFSWMLLITGLFFWFDANPTAAGSKINSIVGDVTSTGFQSLSELPSTGGADNTSLCNSKTGASAASCIQDALWVPLVYQPWLYGQVGNNGKAASKWGPEMLNAQFVGIKADGYIDDDGAKVVNGITEWNGTDDEVGPDSKSGSKIWGGGDFDDKVPYLNLWGNNLCHESGDQNFRMCFGGKDTGWFSDDKRKVKPEDENVISIASGNDFTARISAAAMSVMGGIIINASVYFICAMLLAAKLGVFTLMIFAPFYLLLGIFPGPSRVAAIKLGELFLTNLFRQAGWSLGLVIVTYMDTLILAPGGDQNWVLKILTCALMTVMLGVYAKPAMRALSGMAMGNKDAGDAIVGVGADFAKKTLQTTAQVGAAVATGGATAAMSAGAAVKGASAAASASGKSLSAAEGFKAAGMGVLKNAPNLGRRTRSAIGKFGSAKDAGKEGYENAEKRRDEQASTRAVQQSAAAREGLSLRRAKNVQNAAHAPALDAIAERRRQGDMAGAAALERQHYDSLRDQRTGARHPDDPLHPSNLRRSATGGVDAVRRVRPVERGEDLLSSSGMSQQQASANLDRVLSLYQNAANIDHNHSAGIALRSLSVQIESGGPHTEAARFSAAQAVAQHGLPDKIDAVGLPANSQVTVQVISQVANELPVQPSEEALTPRGRVEFLQRVESLAQQIPVATSMSTALNDLRERLADMKSPASQIEMALQAVHQAAGRERAGTGGGGGA